MCLCAQSFEQVGVRYQYTHYLYGWGWTLKALL